MENLATPERPSSRAAPPEAAPRRASPRGRPLLSRAERPPRAGPDPLPQRPPGSPGLATHSGLFLLLPDLIPQGLAAAAAAAAISEGISEAEINRATQKAEGRGRHPPFRQPGTATPSVRRAELSQALAGTFLSAACLCGRGVMRSHEEPLLDGSQSPSSPTSRSHSDQTDVHGKLMFNVWIVIVIAQIVISAVMDGAELGDTFHLPAAS